MRPSVALGQLWTKVWVSYKILSKCSLFTLIWWPQHCQNYSLIIWIWQYTKPWLKKSVLITYFQWYKLFFMEICFFPGNYFFWVQKRWKKAFLAALHCPTSENKFSHDWCCKYYALLICSSFIKRFWVPYKLLNQQHCLKNTKPPIHRFVWY